MDDIYDEENWEQLLEYNTTKSIEQLNTCFRSESVESELNGFSWPKDLGYITFRSNSVSLNRDEVKAEVEKRGASNVTLLRTVTAKVLDIGWMFNRCHNFLQIAVALQDQPDQFYKTELVKYIFDEFWEQEQRRIILWQLVPFFAYLVVSLVNFGIICEPREADIEHNTLPVYVSCGVHLALWIYLFWAELKQFYFNESKIDHFKSLWNWLDIAGYFLTLFIIASGFIDAS